MLIFLQSEMSFFAASISLLVICGWDNYVIIYTSWISINICFIFCCMANQSVKSCPANVCFTWASYALSKSKSTERSTSFGHKLQLFSDASLLWAAEWQQTQIFRTFWGFSWCRENHCWFVVVLWVWVLFSVLSIFCVTSFGNCSHLQHQETANLSKWKPNMGCRTLFVFEVRILT